MRPTPTPSEADGQRLDQIIPERGYPGGADDALLAFMAWHEAKKLPLYRHQEEAALEFYSGNHVILATPTGSGKSLVARAVHFLALAQAKRSWFTAPIKALVSEKFFELCRDLGAENVGLMTGDATVNPEAPVICCTAEVLAAIALGDGVEARADFVVMDEFHYYGDAARGMAWQLPLLVLERAQFLLMSATLGDTREIEADLVARTGRPVSVVRGALRPVPLSFAYRETPLHETIDQLARGGRAPIYLVMFTQRECAEQAGALLSRDYCDKDEKKAIRETLAGVRFDTAYGKDLKRILEHGVGLHHAGLLPRYRLAVERLAQKGLLKVIVGTDTLGVGINVPIRTVLFAKLCKFDGNDTVILSAREFHQIAGRAGRAGYDTEGFVFVQAPEHVIENKRIDEKVASGALAKKKAKKQNPPEKGYRHWDRATFDRLVAAPPEPLQAVFKVDHGVVLTLLQRAARLEREGLPLPFGGGYRMAIELIERSHLSRNAKLAARAKARRCLDDLARVGLLRRTREGRCNRIDVEQSLQLDFSIHSSLGLWLVAAIRELNPESMTYGLDVVSLVEAIQDSPRALLHAQERTHKGRRVNELKAEGVPFEERQALLEGISYPKPLAEWIYPHFNDWGKLHPWVSEENIAPKGILREMLEGWSGFVEYVNENAMQRIEGLLLRYLSGCWRTLAQTVPEEHKDDQLIEIEAWLRAMLARIDSSLVAAWTEMVEDGAAPLLPDVPKHDISADPRTFAARVRAELHLLLRALHMGDWEEAQALCAWDEAGEAVGLSAAEIEAACLRFYEEFEAPPAFDHTARMAQQTRIEKTGPHQWRVRQRLLSPGEADESPWSIVGRVDLRADTDPAGRVVQVIEITDT